MVRTIKLLLLFFVYQLAVTGFITVLFMILNHSMELPVATDDNYITYLLVVQLAFTICLSVHLLLGKYVTFDKHDTQFIRRPILWLLSFILIVGMALWNNYLNELADFPNTMERFLDDMMRHPLGIVATVIMAPVMEELLFRGAIQGHLMRVWKQPVWAILVSSLLFGLVHGNPAQIPFAFTIGLGLGWMYYMTGSLIPCLFMHFVNNGSAVLFFWLSNHSEASLIGTYGMEIATGLAILGLALTIIGVWGVKKVLSNYAL